ncbi:unnamed protein product [Clavelina lepadiformis]|uniref:BZIP domain-containing protein n=1 Tax=Clavelina lepadiformis TaxID=159417 RepID=A0ABP0FXX5_CLALP
MSLFEGKNDMEFDLLENNYYKLPFCDEDFKEMPTEHWGDNLAEGLSYDIQYHHGLASPLSPSYCFSPSSLSSSSSGGQNQTEHAHSLLNERPDTPLMAVKFEDFSNDFGLNEFGYSSIADESTANNHEKISMDCDVITTEAFGSPNFCDVAIETENTLAERLSTGSERTVDCTLASVATSCFDNNATITISKAEDGSALIKPTAFISNIKEEAVELSLSNGLPVISSVSTVSNLSNGAINLMDATLASKPSSVFLSDQTTTVKSSSIKPIVCPGSPTKPTLNDIIEVSDLITIPSAQKIKVAPQAKITTNTFTHKTQIQIPTSALQTILKNGKLVTKLNQDGQIIPKICIKTEVNDDTPQFVKITQPHADLPPTPPSSTSSDSESSSSPRSRISCSGGPGSPMRPPTHIRVQPTSTQLAAQLLSSTQRFTQTQGPLVLSEEEKRTLLAEGYAIPCKLPLTKTEEKSLKKVRRKIKNKLSAQESRRKKKEYVETLEKRMDIYNKENLDLKRKLDSLESSNRSLLTQLRSLQTLVAGKMPKPSRTVTTQTSSCLMMVVLCFALLLGGWYPHFSPLGSAKYNSVSSGSEVAGYGGESWQSRVLTSFKEDDACLAAKYCHGNRAGWIKEQEENSNMNAGLSEMQERTEETYDEPAGGRVTMNDTGDQTSKIIANTMEPRTAADILASRKVVMRNSKMEVLTDTDAPHEVTKKIVVSSQLVTE